MLIENVVPSASARFGSTRAPPMQRILARGRSESAAKPTFESVEQLVEELGGTRPIRRVLIANNGIAAVKCMRSIRTWAYETFGNDREVRPRGPLCF